MNATDDPKLALNLIAKELDGAQPETEQCTKCHTLVEVRAAMVVNMTAPAGSRFWRPEWEAPRASVRMLLCDTCLDLFALDLKLLGPEVLAARLEDLDAGRPDPLRAPRGRIDHTLLTAGVVDATPGDAASGVVSPLARTPVPEPAGGGREA